MSASDYLEYNLLRHLLQNTTCPNVGDAAGLLASAAAGSLEVSLHTSDPGEAGDQTTNETAYTGYARVAVGRTGTAWGVTGGTGSNVAAVTFPQCTGGSPSTITHFGIGSAHTSTGYLFLSGAISSPVAGLVVNPGITPSYPIGSLTVNLG